MRKKALYIGVIATFLGLCLLGLLARLIWFGGGHHPDALLRAAFAQAAKTTSYSQLVETEDRSEGNLLHIMGTYLVDSAQNRFASYSTTTFSQAGGQPIVFLLADISIGQEVYVNIRNKTPGFRLSVPATGSWEHFGADAIPSAYEGIAFAGPQADDLKLLGKNGAYLSLVQEDKAVPSGDSMLAHYAFSISRGAETAQDAEIRDVAERIGPKGIVDVWIDASTTQVTYMRLSDGSSYTSTTTFSRFNEPLNIVAPSESR